MRLHPKRIKAYVIGLMLASLLMAGCKSMHFGQHANSASAQYEHVDSLKIHFNSADYFVFNFKEGSFPYDAVDSGYLSVEEFLAVDSVIAVAANKYNRETITKDSMSKQFDYSTEELIYNLDNYYYQIAVMSSNSGVKYLFVNALHKEHTEKSMLRKSMAKTSDGGNYYFQMHIMLPAKTYSRFKVNGL